MTARDSQFQADSHDSDSAQNRAKPMAGSVSTQNGLREVLELLSDKGGAGACLKITAGDYTGFLDVNFGIITAALEKKTGQSGLPALERILALRHGMFLSVDGARVPAEFVHDIDVDVAELLSWGGATAPPLELALTAVVGPRLAAKAKADKERSAEVSGQPAIQGGQPDWLPPPPTKTGTHKKLSPQTQPQSDSGRAFSASELDAIASPRPQERSQSDSGRAFSASELDAIASPRPQERSQTDSGRTWSASELDKIASPQTQPPEATASANTGSLAKTTHQNLRNQGATGPIKRFDTEELRRTTQMSSTTQAAGDSSLSGVFIGKLRLLVMPVGLVLAVVLLASTAYLSNQVIKKEAASRSFKTALFFLKQGNRDLAIEQLDQTIKNVTTSSDPYFYRAVAHADRGDFNDAANDYEEAIRLSPDRVAAYIGHAVVSIKLKNYKEAIADATTALQLHPGDIEALLVRSLAYSNSGQLKEAVADCGTVLAAHPTHGLAEAYANRAFAEFKSHELDQAIADYDAAIELSPHNCQFLLDRALCYKEQGHIDKAIADCNQAVYWSPRSVAAVLLRGRCLLADGQKNKAFDDFNRAVYLSPDIASLRARGDAYLAEGAYKEAYSDFEDILNLKHDDKDAQTKHELCYRKFSGALKVADSGVGNEGGATRALITNNFDDMVKQGYELLNQGQAAEAVVPLTQAVRIRSESASARRYLAHALAASGENAGAVAQFKILSSRVTLEPADTLAYAQALSGAGHNQQEVQYFREFLESNPGHVEARTGLIGALMAQGQTQQAAAAAREGLNSATSATDKATFRRLLSEASGGG
jgi:tetratricopeptide (TPR) repeat protein